MTDYRRAKFHGGYYFFTVVTYLRRPFLVDDLSRVCLRSAWRRVQRDRPFKVVAFCLLPDHMHCLWRLPEGDNDFSTRWLLIKKGFTCRYLKAGGLESGQSLSRKTKRERGIWQRRFWEHQIRDEKDLHKHVNYIHYNPVKHGLIDDVEDWPWSTYHRFVREGFYKHRRLNDDGLAGEDFIRE
ncbi:MAG: REP-associated tyrosine transposase [Planctomycetota bacterium]|jgi:putative transposase